MTINSQRALERDVQRIYDEANDYADLHGGVQHGMNVLYGPPILTFPQAAEFGKWQRPV